MINSVKVSSLAFAAPALTLFLHCPLLCGAPLCTHTRPVSLIGPVFSFPPTSFCSVPVPVCLTGAVLCHVLHHPRNIQGTQGPSCVWLAVHKGRSWGRSSPAAEVVLQSVFSPTLHHTGNGPTFRIVPSSI